MHVFASVLLLATAAMAAPSTKDPRNSDSCTQKSQEVKEWQVKDFDYHASYIFTTPAHQNSNGYVNFTLENEPLGFKSVCYGSSSQLTDFFYGNFIYTCTDPVPGPTSTFTFSSPSRELLVNQTWGCAHEGSTFWAQGGTNLTLNCKEEKWQNPDWEAGQTYSSRTVTCDHVDAPVPVTAMQAVA